MAPSWSCPHGSASRPQSMTFETIAMIRFKPAQARARGRLGSIAPVLAGRPDPGPTGKGQKAHRAGASPTSAATQT